MKIRNELARRARYRNGAAPPKMICVKKGSRPVVRANPGELGNLRKNGAASRLKLSAPNVGIISITGLKNHSRTTGATTLKKYFASTADLDETGKITRRWGGRGSP